MDHLPVPETPEGEDISNDEDTKDVDEVEDEDEEEIVEEDVDSSEQFWKHWANQNMPESQKIYVLQPTAFMGVQKLPHSSWTFQLEGRTGMLATTAAEWITDFFLRLA